MIQGKWKRGWVEEKYMTPKIRPRLLVSKAGDRKKRSWKSRYDEDNLETITATAIKRPHRHFCQMRSAQPPEASPEFASPTGLASVVVGGATAGCEVCVARGGVDCCDGLEGVVSDFPRTDSPMFGKSRIVVVQYCAPVRYYSSS